MQVIVLSIQIELQLLGQQRLGVALFAQMVSLFVMNGFFVLVKKRI